MRFLKFYFELYTNNQRTCLKIMLQNLILKESNTGYIASFSFQLTEIVWVRHLVDTDLYTCQHRLTRFTCFHGTHRKFYFLCQMFSHFMPIDSYQHRRSSRFIFDFLKLNLCQYVFVSTFSSVDVNKYYFHF